MSERKVTDGDYLYLSALISARQNDMLTHSKLSRMIDAGSFAEAAEILSESGYADMSGMDAAQIEQTLSEHRRAKFYEMSLLAPEPQIVDAFRLRYDYHNAKVLLKAEGANVDGGYLLSDAGTIPVSRFIDAYYANKFAFFPEELRTAVQEAKAVLSRTGNPQLADFILDRAYFEELLELSKGLSTTFFRDYVAALADSANLRSAVRTMRLGRHADFLHKALVTGGSRSGRVVAEAVAKSASLADVFFGTVFEQAAEKGDAAVAGGSLSEFELACDNAVTEFLRNANRRGFGAEKLVAYLATIENELTAARVVLTDKLTGVDGDKLRERLRESYA